MFAASWARGDVARGSWDSGRRFVVGALGQARAGRCDGWRVVVVVPDLGSAFMFGL